MLKVRIIPTLLWKNFGLVKGVSFDSWRRIGSVLPAIKVYNMREVDELILVDIMATREDRKPDFDSVRDFTAECFVPLTVGGGIRDVKEVQQLLRAGADKVCINTAAFSNPGLITEAARFFGAQCIVASIDARKTPEGSYECMSHSGTVPTGKVVREWAQRLEELGAGEILLTSTERDGSFQGYDVELVRQVSEAVSIPVIASGGAGNFEHMVDVIAEGKASAVAAASIFHFTEQTPLEAKDYLAAKGISVRNHGTR